MSEEPGASKTDERAQLRREREHLRRLRINEAGVALAALLVSVTVIGVNAYNHRRGSQMVVLQPEQIVLYREKGPEASVLWLAMQVQMVNAAREYGDVVVNASATLGPDEPGRFKYIALAEPVISPRAKRMESECPEGARCIAATGFYVVERPKRLLDIPGGASRTEYLAFALETATCEGDEAYCAGATDYEAVLDGLRRAPDNVFGVSLQFQFDGEKRIECRLEPEQRTAIFDYLEVKGFAMPACMSAG